MKHADCGNPGRACIDSSADVFVRDSADCQDGNPYRGANGTQCINTNRAFSRRFKHRPKDDEVSGGVFRFEGFVKAVCRTSEDSNQRSHARSGQSIRRQMHAVEVCGQSNVQPIVDQDLC